MTEILNHQADDKAAREVCLVRFETDLHRELLFGWLKSPHVMRWWGDPAPQLAAALDRPEDSGHSLISLDGILVGYLRWQRVSRVALDAVGLHEIPDDAVDIDILIGAAQQVGMGIGPRALELLIASLRAEPSVHWAGMSTSVDNIAAIRAYEKAGFARLKQYVDPEAGPCWVMLKRL